VGLDATDNVPDGKGRKRGNFVDSSKQFVVKRKKREEEDVTEVQDPFAEDAASITREFDGGNSFAGQFSSSISSFSSVSFSPTSSTIPSSPSPPSMSTSSIPFTAPSGNAKVYVPVYDRIVSYKFWYGVVIAMAYRIIGFFFFFFVIFFLCFFLSFVFFKIKNFS
jgi:hypothetical protein